MAIKPSSSSLTKVSFLTSSFQSNHLQAQIDQLKEQLYLNKQDFQHALETKESEKQDIERRIIQLEEQK